MYCPSVFGRSLHEFIDMRILLLLLSLSLIGVPAWPQVPEELSKASRVSLITCGPGDQAYSLYGHTAIRVTDTVQGFDLTFNYGIFSQSKDGFIYKFCKGETDYELGIQYFEGFIDDYQEDGRSVNETPLNLTFYQRKKLFRLLMVNYLPENRVYRYHFFSDNCATRPRDILEKMLGDSLRWNFGKGLQSPKETRSFVELCHKTPVTYRQLITHYQNAIPWLNVGIDLPMASPADTAIHPRQALFLPDFLMDALSGAEVLHVGGWQPLAGASSEILPQKVFGTQPPERPAQLMWMGCGVFVVISFLGLKWHRHSIAFDALLYFIAGLSGLFILFAAFISDHESMWVNYNVLWAMPLLFAMPILLYIKKVRRWASGIALVWHLVAMLAWYLVPQELNAAYLALCLLMVVRGITFLSVHKPMRDYDPAPRLG